ncbi:hypothetical protein T265_05839 [Opisthorchis viverrini]|uniref:WD domain, G-beta repeat protein n=1 Tax=Opisthorchis viverrini TaxID=6198 RepID=A0A074ZJ40_OPIVI|nr:hypothetical protein T265_05839 [Opisthorchis viverrini]KER27006.1 hypothetical protein T265_05839 [Opisthorchis viverrini]
MDLDKCKYYLKGAPEIHSSINYITAETILDESNQHLVCESAEPDDLGYLEEEANFQDIITETLRRRSGDSTDVRLNLKINNEPKILEHGIDAIYTAEVYGRVDEFIRHYLLSNSFFETLNSFQVEWCVVFVLRAHYAEYEPIFRQLQQKYEAAMREKSLNQIERDRAVGHAEELRSTLLSLQQFGINTAEGTEFEKISKKSVLTGVNPSTKAKLLSAKLTGQNEENKKVSENLPKIISGSGVSEIPRDKGVNPLLRVVSQSTAYGVCPSSRKLNITVKGHEKAISSLSINPSKSLICSTSDDKQWKIWRLPELTLLLTTKAHKDWISSSDFNPMENILATASGDSSIRVWRYDLAGDPSDLVDFSGEREEELDINHHNGNENKAACLAKLIGHAGAVWSVNWHWSGRFLISGGTDSTVRIWDVEMTKTVSQMSSERRQQCRSTFRKQTGTVNSTRFLPYGNILVSASTDKTVAVWDARAGICIQTLLGHNHPVTYALFNQQGTLISSCDTSGIVRLWDLRQIGPHGPQTFKEPGSLCQTNLVDLTKVHSNQPSFMVNQLDFELSGEFLVAACADARIYCIEVADGTVTELEGHEDAVQSAVFDYSSNRLYSAGSDGNICGWW